VNRHPLVFGGGIGVGGRAPSFLISKSKKDACKGSTREETARQGGKDAPNPHFAQAASTKHKRSLLTGRNPPPSRKWKKRKRKKSSPVRMKKRRKK